MEYVLALLAGSSMLAIFAAVALPGRKVAHISQRVVQEQMQLREARGLGFLMPTLAGIADVLQGREGAEGVKYGRAAGRPYLALLRQADWFWGPGEAAPPNPDAPFWNLETMWAAKVFRGILFALGGLVLVGAALAVFHGPLWMALLGLLLGLVGFFDPDQEVAQAAEKRRRQIILEMGYKVPELRVYVRSGRTFISALRYLTSRPGGPFVKELYRALQVYDITADLGRGLKAVMEHNQLCEPLVNFCADLLAVLAEGGELGPVLEAHAETAQHEQRRLLRQQGQDNTQAMGYVVSATTLIVIFLLVGGPALWTVVTNLAGF